MEVVPQRTEEHESGETAIAIIHYQLDHSRWLFRQETGRDYGVDFVIDLVEDCDLVGRRILCQAKGTRVMEKRVMARVPSVISYPYPVKTINYGLKGQIPMALFLVDLVREDVYFVGCRELFSQTLEAKALTSTKNVHFDINRTLRSEPEALVKIAFS